MILLSINYTSYEDIPSFSSKFYITNNEYESLSDEHKEKINPIITKVGNKYVYTIFKINTNNSYFTEIIADILSSLYSNRPIPSLKDCKFEIVFIEEGTEYIYSYEISNGQLVDEELYYKIYKIHYDGDLIEDDNMMYQREETSLLEDCKKANIKSFKYEIIKENDDMIENDYDKYSPYFNNESDLEAEFNKHASINMYEINNISSLTKSLQDGLLVNFSQLFSFSDYDDEHSKVFLPEYRHTNLRNQMRRHKLDTLFSIHSDNIEVFGLNEYTDLIENVLSQTGYNLSIEFKSDDYGGYYDAYVMSVGRDSLSYSIFDTKDIDLLNTITSIGFAVYHVLSNRLKPTPLILNSLNMNNLLVISLRTIYATGKLMKSHQTGHNQSHHQLFLIEEEDKSDIDKDNSIYDKAYSYIPQVYMNEEFNLEKMYDELH